MKRLIATALCAIMVVGTFAGCGAKETPAAPSTDAGSQTTTGGDAQVETPTDDASVKVINLWSFTDEIPKMVDKYVADHPDFGYEIKPTIIATTDGAYQPALDAALAGGGADAPDIYAAEAAFVLKYAQGDASGFAATYKELGIDVDKMLNESNIAKYSVEIGTRPSDGEVVALGYQATGGAFIYRRSIAKDVWGTDDPATVQEKIGGGSGSWDQFWVAAEDLKAKGYGIVSGDGDIWHAVENSSPTGWVVDGKLNIDPKREEFIDLSMKLKENNYHNDTQDWTEAWYADMAGTGEKGILGFFGPAWLINYVMAGNSGDTYGDWAICNSPIGFFWGGTWILGNKDSKVKNAVGDIIEWITLDNSNDGLQYAWANGTVDWDNDPETPTSKDSVASGTVMDNSDGKLDFLGGQNMFEYFVPANAYANGKNLTQYDETINSCWRDAVRAYTSGSKTRDEAIAFFKEEVSAKVGIDVE